MEWSFMLSLFKVLGPSVPIDTHKYTHNDTLFYICLTYQFSNDTKADTSLLKQVRDFHVFCSSSSRVT